MNVNADEKSAFALEVTDALLRRWWTIVAGICVGLVAALIALNHLPKIYEAETKIFVARQRIPEDFVRSTVTDDMKLRMAALREAVLSRPYLQRIIETHYTPAPEGEELERMIDSIRWKVGVAVRKGLFAIKFRDEDPQRAAAVVNALAQLYIDENANFRATRASETTKTLEQLADSVLVELTEKENAIREFKAKHPFETESNIDSNLRMREMLQRDYETNERTLQYAREQRAGLDAELTRARNAPVVSLDDDGVDDPYVIDLAGLQRQLDDLMAHYTPEHPKVKAKIREIEDYKRTRAPAVAEEAGDPGVPPAVRRVQGKIDTAEKEIADLEEEQSRLKKEIARYDARIEATPIVQARLSELTKGHSALKARYDDYQSKVETAKGAQQIEEGRKGEQFEVIEEAMASSIPVEPLPLFVFGANLAWALALFVGPVLLKQIMHPVIASQKGLKALADVPLLVAIPPLMTEEVQRRARRFRSRNIGLSILSVAMLATAMFFVYR